MSASWSSTGREFQADGPATEKARQLLFAQPVPWDVKMMMTGGP